ncbi:MAG TPA: amidohydrolase family protein [Vicinamibacterales bacterium]|nr:amidohydrolase family protein [Vicinamibacterales bacterium]
MNNRHSLTLDRRGFLKLGVGAGAALGMSVRTAFAQERPAWDARPANPASVRPVSIDMHTHWAPERYTRAQVEMGRPAPANPFPLDFDLAKRVTWMNEHGLQMHVLTLSGGMPWQWATPEQGVRLAQIVNDAAVEAHMAYPDRFVAGIAMPIRDPEMALKELNRVAGKPGMRAVHLPNSIEQRDYLFEPAFEPILARCQELGYPLLFHPLDGEANFYSTRLVGPPSVTNWLGFTFEHATTALKFITTGTLDKFPRLEIVLPHGGGAFPFIFARVEHGFFHMGSAQLKTERPFKEYLRRFHYDYLNYYPEALRFLIGEVGSDRIVIGTDLFAARDIEYPNSFVEQLKLPAGDLDRILRGNAKRLLHL